MSDIPVPQSITRKNTSDVDPALVDEVVNLLSSFNKQNSFINENLNELNKSFSKRQKKNPDDDNKLRQQEEEDALPKRESLLRYGGIAGAAAVYIGDILFDVLKVKEGDDKSGGIMSKLFGKTKFGGMAQRLFPALMKTLPFAAIAGGILWGVIDAIQGVAKAQDWGVSKISAAIGGFFGGAGNDQIKRMFGNMGKFALIGAAIGSIVPVIGTLTGGLVGAAIGGILGFIGGEKIAKGIDKVKGALSNLWKGLDINLKKVLKSMGAWAVVGAGIGSVVPFIGTLVGGLIGAGLGAIFELIDFKALWKKIKKIGIGGLLGEFISFLGKGISKIWEWIKESFGSVFNSIGTVASNLFHGSIDWIRDSIIQPILQFVGNGIQTAIQGITDIGTWFGTYIINPIKSFFSKVGEGIAGGVRTIVDFFKFHLIFPIRNFFNTIGSFFDAFQGKSFGDVVKMLIGGGVDETIAQEQEKTTRSIAKEQLQLPDNILNSMDIEAIKSQLQKQGIWFPGIQPQKVDDLIITPKGEAFQTNPSDTVIALKNLSSIMEGQTNSDINAIMEGQRKIQENQNESIVNAIKGLGQSVGNRKEGNTMVQQNFTSRYSPTNIMESLSATGAL